MATPSAGWDNKFSTTLSSGITATDTTIPLTNLPTASEGWLVIEPDSSTAWEEIYYTSKTGSGVVCPSVAAGRGQGGSTAASHTSGATVRCDTTAEMFEALQDGTAITNGVITPNKLQASTGTTWALQSWTPTWTNLTIGNGTNASKYVQIGKLVYFKIDFTLGSTSSVGTAPNFTLPVTSVSYNANTYIGEAGLTDSSASTLFPGPLLWLSTTTCQVQCLNVSGASVINASISSSNPFGAAWATSDSIKGWGIYEAA